MVSEMTLIAKWVAVCDGSDSEGVCLNVILDVMVVADAFGG